MAERTRRSGASLRTDALELRLYVAGATKRSADAIEAITTLCDGLQPDQYTLEVIDIYRHPARAQRDQIVAVPTLIKSRPEPFRRLIGNLSDSTRLRGGLGLPAVA